MAQSRIAFMQLSNFLLFFVYYSVDHRDLHSFPTRRSSDLVVDVEIKYSGTIRNEKDLVLNPHWIAIVVRAVREFLQRSCFQVSYPKRRRISAAVVTPVAGAGSRVVHDAGRVRRHRSGIALVQWERACKRETVGGSFIQSRYSLLVSGSLKDDFPSVGRPCSDEIIFRHHRYSSRLA